MSLLQKNSRYMCDIINRSYATINWRSTMTEQYIINWQKCVYGSNGISSSVSDSNYQQEQGTYQISFITKNNISLKKWYAILLYNMYDINDKEEYIIQDFIQSISPSTNMFVFYIKIKKENG